METTKTQGEARPTEAMEPAGFSFQIVFAEKLPRLLLPELRICAKTCKKDYNKNMQDDYDFMLNQPSRRPTPPSGVILTAILSHLFVSILVAGLLYKLFINFSGIETRAGCISAFCFTFFLVQYSHKAMTSITTVLFIIIRWRWIGDVFYVGSPIHTIYKINAYVFSFFAWIVILLIQLLT